LSHHIGDLDYYEAQRAFAESIGHYERLFGFRPEAIAHDLHPDYASTRLASTFDASLPRIPVQHHHAHMASCMAENGLVEPVIGVTFDGAGLGEDGTVWGGEFLVGDYRGFRRAAHLRYVVMPGGDRATREPWRMAAAYLADAGLDDGLLGSRVPSAEQSTVRRMIERRLNAPATSSMGRLFDAVASLAGVRDRVGYEGQAAIELEGLASDRREDGCYPFEIAGADDAQSPFVIDVRPMICTLASDVRGGCPGGVVARRFHDTIVHLVAETCGRLRGRSGLSAVVLSGGVFQNALLTECVADRLGREGFRVHRHRRVPPGDGGLSLGQAAIAAATVGL
jgi:hydrogenase maturation protein HypF